MPLYPWRFQADITVDTPDPDVTVFVGDTVTNDSTGEKKVMQDVSDPIIVKLSELDSYISNAMTNGVTRTVPKEPEPEKKAKK